MRYVHPILIALEFIHSILAVLKRCGSISQVRTVVLTAGLAPSREFKALGVLIVSRSPWLSLRLRF